jgi:hypothetical protein
MSVCLGRAIYDLCISTAASAIVAFMVLAGGMALEVMPSDAAETSVSPRVDQRNPLVLCRADREGFRCIPEAS